jgi:phage-related protein
VARRSREIASIKAARKDFQKFPRAAQLNILRQLTVVAEGAKPDDARPLKGLGPGVWEIALKYQTNAYRTVFIIELNDAVWVLHAFQKKSPKGIKTAKQDIELIRTRLKRLKEILI